MWFEESLAYDNARLPQALIVTGMATRNARLCRRRSEVPALADDAANGADGPFPAGRHGQFRRTSTNCPALSISSRSKRPRRSRPAWRRCARTAMLNGRPTQPGFSPGSSAATTCRLPSSTPRPAVAATDCIPTAPTKTAGRVGRVLSSGTCRDSSACPRQCQPGKFRGASRRRGLIPSARLRPSRGTLLHATFLNRQALYLRPDPARVIVRPFKPATEPRDLNPTDKTRANHIVERVLGLDVEGGGTPAGGCAGEFRGQASQPAGDVRAPRRRNGRSACGALHFFQGPAPAHRRLFPERVFVRSLGAVQSRASCRTPTSRGRRQAACASFSASAPSAKDMCRR